MRVKHRSIQILDDYLTTKMDNEDTTKNIVYVKLETNTRYAVMNRIKMGFGKKKAKYISLLGIKD
jgi:hypothetical protein